MEKIETWLSYLLLVALTMSDIFSKYSRLDPTTISSPVIVKPVSLNIFLTRSIMSICNAIKISRLTVSKRLVSFIEIFVSFVS